MEIVLVAPEIPQNTGNVARTCALTGTRLNLIKPLGFSLSDRYLKRAGLDYWDKVEIIIWESFEEYAGKNQSQDICLATTKGSIHYNEISYHNDTVLVFGSESKGLPDIILNKYPQKRIRIPMIDLGRSLNLSNSVAVILFEALRQNQYPGLK